MVCRMRVSMMWWTWSFWICPLTLRMWKLMLWRNKIGMLSSTNSLKTHPHHLDHFHYNPLSSVDKLNMRMWNSARAFVLLWVSCPHFMLYEWKPLCGWLFCSAMLPRCLMLGKLRIVLQFSSIVLDKLITWNWSIHFVDFQILLLEWLFHLIGSVLFNECNLHSRPT